jgi:molybdopterin molybdotransferase
VRALLGETPAIRPFRAGRLASAVRRLGARDQLVRSRSSFEDGEVVLEPVAGQESHMAVRAARADALVRVEPGDGELAAGADVRFLTLS